MAGWNDAALITYLSFKGRLGTETDHELEFCIQGSLPFVPGEKTEDVIRAIRELNENGFNATLNHLGEHLSTADEAEKRQMKFSWF